MKEKRFIPLLAMTRDICKTAGLINYINNFVKAIIKKSRAEF